jgi:Sulfatase
MSHSEQPGPEGRLESGTGGEPLSWYRVERQPAPPALRARWWWPGRERTLDALACLALSALCFSQASLELLFRADRDFYNQLPLGAPTLVALILNIVALAAGGLLVMQAIRRVRRPVWRRLAAVAAATTLLIALNFARITYETVGRWTDAIGRPGLLAFVVLVLATSLCWPRPALRAIRRIALGASPLGVVTLVSALWMFLEMAAGPVWRRVDPAPLKTPAPSLRRVVWLVFEELDQAITFEARPPGLELPELDRFRRESLYTDDARPPAGTAEVSMPALITGRPVVAVVPISPDDLELTFADGKSARWSAQPNVFSRARVFGYDTALVGWYLPYPRVLGSALGAAAWRPSVVYEQTRGSSLSQALRNQWESLAPPVHARRLLIQRFAELGDLALRAATDGRFGLVLLHLPLPQSPGIYDRATGQVTAWNFRGADAEYLDNLALADRLVGELRRGLERARLGDRTWIVVSSDRWRASKRRDGQADRRVPFLVRPPDGGRAVHVDGALNTLGTHDLVLAILRGSISDTAGAADWLVRSRSAPPRDYTSLGRPIY